MMPTLRDEERQAELAVRGVTVLPFLEPHEVERLRAGYRALAADDDHGLTIDYMRPDRGFMASIAALVAPVWERHFDEVFVDHRPVFATFVVKHPGEASNMFLHEDRTYVDERQHRAGVLWIPLVDVGPGLDNGGLEVIPGSHRLTTAWSGTDTPELFRPFEDHLRERLEPHTVPAGWTAFYDTRLLHASPANRSSEPREALVCAVAPRAADLIHVVATSPTHRKVHRVDEHFFVDVHPHAVERSLDDRYPVIEEFDDASSLTLDDVRAILGEERAPVSSSTPGSHRSARSRWLRRRR
jgi:hypothetical protein